jgi:nitrogen regulatory protein P-II 1
MKTINAVITPSRLARLRAAFRRIPDFPGMTVVKAEGSGYHPGKPHAPGVKGELTEYSARIRIEIVSPDDMVARLVAIIHEACHTGHAGDGVAWVAPVESFQRLREPLARP